MSEIKDTKAFSINDFLSWNLENTLKLSPKYQRNTVWNQNAKSYLIDSIIKGFPIPQIFYRQTIDINTRVTIREVIDGQQRLRAIIEFSENTFQIKKSHNTELGGKFYKDLDDTLKEQFLLYNIAVEIIKIKDDARIYEMFARLNTNNMALNKQELRNAKFWGEFKVFVYNQATKFKYFFIANKTFNDKEFSRMLDVEYLNSFVIQLIDGLTTDSGAKTDTYYRRYDNTFDKSDEVEHKLDYLFEILSKIFENNLFQTRLFHTKNYLFTLFTVLNYQIFDNKDNEIIKNEKFKFDEISKHIPLLVSKIMNFEANLSHTISDIEKNTNNDLDNYYILFDKLHRTRTTSVKERKERVKILSNYLCN